MKKAKTEVDISPEIFMGLASSLDEYLWDCEASLDESEESEFKTITGQDFCGCTACYTREQIYFLAPRIIEAYEGGEITWNN